DGDADSAGAQLDDGGTFATSKQPPSGGFRETVQLTPFSDSQNFVRIVVFRIEHVDRLLLLPRSDPDRDLRYDPDGSWVFRSRSADMFMIEFLQKNSRSSSDSLLPFPLLIYAVAINDSFRIATDFGDAS